MLLGKVFLIFRGGSPYIFEERKLKHLFWLRYCHIIRWIIVVLLPADVKQNLLFT